MSVIKIEHKNRVQQLAAFSIEQKRGDQKMFNLRIKRAFWIAIVMVGLSLSGLVAQVPDHLNYQGVLRDAAGVPLNTSVDVVFRLFDADVAGSEIIVDRHLLINGQAVEVTDGLFDVQVGSGEVLDGTGAGVYTSMAEVFRSHSSLWLEVQIEAETLSPRTPVSSSGYAMNSKYLDGMTSSEFVDTTGTSNTKQGGFIAGANNSTPTGIEGYGTSRGGYFADVNDSGYAEVGSGNIGVRGYGSVYGGYFEDTDGTGYARLGDGHYGVVSYGETAGGWFQDISDGGIARVGFGNTGVHAEGPVAGGYFEDSNASGWGYVGYNDYGVYGSGDVAGGYFLDSNATGRANVAWGNYGIYSYGSTAGGRFSDSDGSGQAYVGYGNYGVWAFGSSSGGYFYDSDSSGRAYVGYGDTGTRAWGSVEGGYFYDSNSSGYARVGYGEYGIQASGNTMGGLFEDPTQSGVAYLGYSDYGVYGFGTFTGGYFNDSDSSGWARVGYSTYKIYGSGTVSFIQNHPTDSTKSIVYHAPEASEVATYTRGSGRIVNGTATIQLDETFQWVTNPDIGLTAHITPRGLANVAVTSVSPTTLVVQGTEDVEFDYMVWGLRIGFEELAPVQEKTQEAMIPSMAEHRDTYEKNPTLRQFNALERFKSEISNVRGVDVASLDLSKSQALKASIGEFNPELHELSLPPGAEQPEERTIAPHLDPTNQIETPELPDVDQEQVVTTDVIAMGAFSKPQAPSTSGNSLAETDSTPEVNDDSWFDVSDNVKVGDVLALDPVNIGQLKLAETAIAAEIVGIAATETRVNDEGQMQVKLADTRYVSLTVDAGYGAVIPGDLLIISPTPGHAMRSIDASGGMILGKAIDGLETGTGTVRVLLMLR